MSHNPPPTVLAPFLLAVLIAMCVAFGLVLISDEADQSHGYPHAQYPQSMQQGGPGTQRHSEVRWLGLVIGLLEVAFFVGCLLLGIRRGSRRVLVFTLLGAFYGATVALMAGSDVLYARGELQQIVLGFPLPTSLMIYAVGGAPLAFILIYVIYFDRWVLPPDDFQRFERLVQQKRQQREAGS